MDSDAQNKEIEEACGWLRDHISSHAMYYVPSEDSHVGNPAYDLNAMQEAERTLTPIQSAEYARLLTAIAWQSEQPVFAPMTATAAQRREAFVRTIGKWTTNQKSV